MAATEAPFSEKEYFDRCARAQALMEHDGLDALVLSEKNNYWYITGLISYQLDHIQRPQICFLPKRGKAQHRPPHIGDLLLQRARSRRGLRAGLGCLLDGTAG